MKTKLIQQHLEELAISQDDIMNLLQDYFFVGNVEHQIGLISNAIQEVVNKGTDNTDASIDADFVYTNRYIRESVNDLTELQKFLIRLHIVFADYKHQRDRLILTKERKNTRC